MQKIFAEDEMGLRAINQFWSAEELLSQEGIFYLKDVARVLDLDPNRVKKKALELVGKEVSPWEKMGVKKVFTHWVVRMKVFAPYFRKQCVSKLNKIQPDWDGNIFLKQKGLFSLTDVCKLIPFSTQQLRYQAKAHPNAREEFGIWKDDELNSFVVDMERFGYWIGKLWRGEYKNA